jgi:lysophospholipase L1-like esterase
LKGRTTAYDDPADSTLNGQTFLPVCLASHAPIDQVVIFLGTNDLFLPGGIDAHFAGVGVGILVDRVSASIAGPGGTAPRVFAVVPPPFAPLGKYEPWSPNGLEESRQFLDAFRRMASERDVTLIDLTGVVQSSLLDGVHFDADGHRAIGEVVAAALR